MVNSSIFVLEHPLAGEHLIRLRDKDTSPEDFRTAVRRLTQMLVVEATRDLETVPVSVETPLTVTQQGKLSQSVAVVPILRAGLGMEAPVLDLIPAAPVWHLGLYRNEETKQPVEYYQKFPQENPPDCALVVDPMLATGGSICMALDILQEWGVKTVKVLGLIGAPEGVKKVQEEHPSAQIYLAALDDHLNEEAYIVPGLGDAGDRIFNT